MPTSLFLPYLYPIPISVVRLRGMCSAVYLFFPFLSLSASILVPINFPIFFSHLTISSLFSILAICFKLLSYCFPSLSLSHLECRRERERGGRGVKSHLGFYKKFKTNFQTGYFLLVVDRLYTTCVLGA